MCRILILFLLLTGAVHPLSFALESEEAADDAELRSDSPADDQAVRLFLVNKYEEALPLFREKAARNPSDLAARRYVGACLSALRRDDEAFSELASILAEFPEDLPTLKMTAKMRLRRGEPERAKMYLERMAAYDESDGRFAAYAKDQLEKLAVLEEGAAARSEGQMGAEAFMRTPGVVHFMDAEYEKALEEFERMETLHPRDLMLKRYKGLALDRLKRHEEAIQTFREGLEIAPGHAALRYALAQTHFHKQDFEASREALKFLSQSAVASDYKVRADRDLEALDRIETLRAQAEGKKWFLYLEQGIEFNSNAASEPLKLQVPSEEHAVRFPGTVYGSYELKKAGPWTMSASYVYSQAFYSDTLDYLNTRVHMPALQWVHFGEWMGKPLLTSFSTSYVHVSVENEYYYQSYPQTLRWIYSFWDRHRLILSERISWTDYKDQGAIPAQTSREGVGNAINVTNNFYFNEQQKLYIGLSYEYRVDDTEGSLYVRDVHQGGAELNFPVWKDWTGLVGFRYKNSDYPETTADIQREDNEYLVNTRLTVPLSKSTSVKFFYDYLNSDSNDPLYRYVNHSGGLSLTATY
jgi:tetratricopeptide (TPR) repeat protein